MPLWKYKISTSEVRAPYLVSVDHGMQTVMGFSKNQLVVHLRQMLQHLPSKREVSVLFHFVISVAEGRKTQCRADLVHLTTGCGDVDRLQLHGDEEPNKKQEMALR